MTRLKWLHLTQLVAAMTTVSVAAAAADDPQAKPADGKQVAQATPQPTPEGNPEQVPPAPPAVPEATQATPPPTAPPPTSPAPAPAAAEEEKPLPPGSFKIPGTTTVLTLSGYAQMDVTYDFKGRDPVIEGNDWAVHASNLPLNRNYEVEKKSGQLYLTARTSRVGISTMTKTDIADIGATVEGDFNAGNLLSGQLFTNSVLFRLRHAYGTLSGKYGTLLFGQSWSTMLDLPSYAETVDFNGPGSIPLIRQPQIRYTMPLGDSMSFAVAAENAPGTDRSGYPALDGAAPTRRVQQIPDLIAVLAAKGDWGSASLGAVALQYKNAGKAPTAALPEGTDGYSKHGWGVRAAAAIKLPWGDRFRAYGAGGNGIGRYLFNAALQGQGATVSVDDDAFRLWQAIAYHVNYTRVWSPVVRTNVVWSQTFMKFNGSLENYGFLTSFDPNTFQIREGIPNKRIDQLFVNTFFTVNKQVEFGLEYAFSERNTFGNDDAPNNTCDQTTGGACASQKGTMHRVTGSLHVNFF